jgi:hypothetical protein
MSIPGGLSRRAESYSYIHHRRLGLPWFQHYIPSSSLISMSESEFGGLIRDGEKD